MDRQALRDIRRKLNCLQFAQDCGSVVLTCRKLKRYQYTAIDDATRSGHSGKNIYSSISPTRNIGDYDDGASKNYIGNGSVSDHHWPYNKSILQPS